MRDWPQRLAVLLEGGPVVVVTVLSAEGSTPREVGARMLVTCETTEGTIGGGALEYAAIADAREMLTSQKPWHRRMVDMPLGPAVQQCCGGFVRLLYEVVTAQQRSMMAELLQSPKGLIARPCISDEPWKVIADRQHIGDIPLPVAHVVRAMLSGSRRAAPLAIECGDTIWLIEPIARPRIPLYLYGAGHVAREVVAVLDGLAYDIHWIDVTRRRFPDQVDPAFNVVATDDPSAYARAAPAGGLHVVMTFSHALDEEITAALLDANAFGYLGLIGSKTKRARFIQRFRRAGISESGIARLTCPIGVGGITGKEPRMIAIALAAELLQLDAAARASTRPVVATSTRPPD